MWWRIWFPVLVMTIAGCASRPEQVVEEYLENTFIDCDAEKAYTLISEEDKSYKTVQEFAEQINHNHYTSNTFLRDFKEYYKYEIDGTRKVGDTIFVETTLIRPDVEAVMKELLGLTLASFYYYKSGKEQADIQESFKNSRIKEEISKVVEKKEFKVISEHGKYRVFLDLGYNEKLTKMQERVQNLLSYATEHERIINYDSAYHVYSTILAMNSSDQVKKKIAEIKRIKQNTVTTGNTLMSGKLEFTPLKVELTKTEDQSEVIRLTFRVRNTCDAEVFSLGDQSIVSQISDNYGNTMTQVLNEGTLKSIRQKLAPGETRVISIYCEAPLSRKADKFLWSNKLYINNRKTEETLYVWFTRDQILSSERADSIEKRSNKVIKKGQNQNVLVKNISEQ